MDKIMVKNFLTRLKIRIINILKNEKIIKLKLLKMQIENGSKKKKIFLNFCIIIIIIYSFFFIINYVIRLYFAFEYFFLKIFPHMSEDSFKVYYGYDLKNFTFFQKVKFFWLDFIIWDSTTIIFKIVFLILIFIFFFFIISFFKYIFFKKDIKINKEKFFVITNIDITKNLLFYHYITKDIIEKIKSKETLNFDEFYEMKNFIIENTIELYYIIKNQPAKNLLQIVVLFKKEVLKDLFLNPNEMQQLAFDNLEKQYLDDLIVFLEKKEKNNDNMFLELDAFVALFSKIEIKE